MLVILDIIINQIGKEIVFKTNNKDNHFGLIQEIIDRSLINRKIIESKETNHQPGSFI